MIALDANTALRSFRDAAYDVEELCDKFAVLTANIPAMCLFKYADGSVQPMASAMLVHELVTSFQYLTVGGTIGIAARDGGIVLENASAQAKQLRFILGMVLPVAAPGFVSALESTLRQLDGTIALQAEIDGEVLVYAGEGSVPIENSHIRTLSVGETLYAEDVGSVLDGAKLQQASAAAGRFVNMECDSIEAEKLSSLGGRHEYVQLQTSSVRYPAASVPGAAYSTEYTSALNEVFTATRGTEALPAYLGKLGLAPRICEEVRLKSDEVKLKWELLSGVQSTGRGTFRYAVPYYENGSVSYLPVASAGVTLTREDPAVSPPEGFEDMLLWPAWDTVGSYESSQYSKVYDTTWRARILSVDDVTLPSIRVVNASDEEIEGVATVWSFGKTVSDGYVRGQVHVLNRVTLPPLSSVEFLFSYNAVLNYAYMFPTRGLENG